MLSWRATAKKFDGFKLLVRPNEISDPFASSVGRANSKPQRAVISLLVVGVGWVGFVFFLPAVCM
ncbi:hypothetical protein [Hydrogenophaga sp.]|uniref:hypothetical protein n=1 Tax=Hydrogenophaga sp. TaxID=1904254 RepID=UPI00277455F6|nr:hypothetical protein [Hydrogenophaga sp.]MDP2418503.1 hypothetical protein [Hydrogenophaga sp.]